MIITLYYSSYLVLQSCSASHRNLQACARAAGVAYDTTKERRVEPSNFLRTVRRKKNLTMQSLFPGQIPGALGGGNKPVVSLKWGKCFVVDMDNGKKFKITPDVRKGLFEMTGKGPDQMHHIKWKDRTSGAQEEDLFVFPGEQTLEKVDTGRPDDRVYLLQFKNGKRSFFWSQEFDEEAEKKKVEDLQKYLKDPSTIPAPTPAQAAQPGGGASDADLLRQLMGGAVPAQGGQQQGGGGQISESDLRAILQSMGQAQGTSNPPAPQAGNANQPPAPPTAEQQNLGQFQEGK